MLALYRPFVSEQFWSQVIYMDTKDKVLSRPPRNLTAETGHLV